LRGLTNFGNTCWFNALAGLLFSKAHGYVEYMAEVASSIAVNSPRDPSASGLMVELLTLAQQVRTHCPGNPAVSSSGFWKQVRKIRKPSPSGPVTGTGPLLQLLQSKGTPEDPRELLNQLGGFLGGNRDLSQASPVSFEMHKAISCAHCGGTSKRMRVEEDQLLLLPVVHGNLLLSLEEFFSPVSGESNVSCSLCGRGKKEDVTDLNLVEESFLGSKSPLHLLVCLRGKELVASEGMGGLGDAVPLCFPKSLDLKKFVIPNSNSAIAGEGVGGAGSWKYELSGFCAKLEGVGHHIAVLRVGKGFVLLDDNVASPISDEKALKLRPTVLLYSKPHGGGVQNDPGLANAIRLLGTQTPPAPQPEPPPQNLRGYPPASEEAEKRGAPRSPLTDKDGFETVVAKRRGSPEASKKASRPVVATPSRRGPFDPKGADKSTREAPAASKGSGGALKSAEPQVSKGSGGALKSAEPQVSKGSGGALKAAREPHAPKGSEAAPKSGRRSAHESPQASTGSPGWTGSGVRAASGGAQESTRQLASRTRAVRSVSGGAPKGPSGGPPVPDGAPQTSRAAPQVPEVAPTTLHDWPLGCAYTLHFDGGAQNCSPRNRVHTHKMGGAGAILFHIPSGCRVWSGGEFLPAGKGTGNNVTSQTAEYAGLLFGLRILADLAPTQVLIFGDSSVIIGQVKGDKAVSAAADHLRPLRDSAQRIIKDLRAEGCTVSLQHFLRANNGAADDLASLAMFGQENFSAWTVRPDSFCLVAGSDDQSQKRHGFESRWNSAGHGGESAPESRLKRVRTQLPAVPANPLSRQSSQQSQGPSPQSPVAPTAGPAPQSRTVRTTEHGTGPRGPSVTCGASGRASSRTGAAGQTLTRQRSSVPTGAFSGFCANTVFWGRKATGLRPESGPGDTAFFPATFLAFRAEDNLVRCRFLDPGELSQEVYLPASMVLGALTEQELRFLHGHGDLSSAPPHLSLPAPDSERSRLTRVDFRAALEYLDSQGGGCGSALTLGMFESVQLTQGWNSAQGLRALSWLGSPGGVAGGSRAPLPFRPELLIRRPRHTTTKIPAPLLDDWRRINMIIVDLLRQFDDMEEQRGVIFGLLMALPMLCLREAEHSSARAKKKVIRSNFEAFLRGDLHSLYAKALDACAPRDVATPRAAPASAPRPMPLPAHGAPVRPDHPASVQKGLRAVALVRGGNASKGVRELTSAGPAKGSVATIVEELSAKHPQPLEGSEGLFLSDLSALELLASHEYLEEKFDFSAVMKAARSIQALGCQDSNGWRGREHLLPLLKEEKLGVLFTEFVFKAIITGRLPDRFRGYLAGASLIALDKAPKAGIRPIAIGDLFRRVASKAALRPLARGLGTYFQTSSPNLLQFAVGVPGGAEKLCHILALLPDGTQSECFDDDDPEGFMGFDISNAFNDMDRQIIFDVLDGMASRDYAGGRIKRGDPLPCPPGLQLFAAHFRAYYGSSSFLTFRGADGSSHTILSSRGVQQGDVWGPTLFCAAVHPLVAIILRDEAFLKLFGLSFSDNLTVNGKVSSLLAFAAELKPTFADVGLQLNPEDSKIFVPSWSANHGDHGCAAWERFKEKHDTMGFAYCPHGLKIVGCPFGSDDFCESVFEECLARTVVDLPKLDIIPDGLIHFTLLKTCINSRFNYFCRCAPPRLTRATAEKFDVAVSSSLSRYLKIPVFDGGASDENARNSPWFDALIQLRLPVRDGGGGLTSVADVNLPAFYSALASTLQWLARGSEVHRKLIPPSPTSAGSQGPLYLGDFLDAQAVLVQAGAALVSLADLGDPERPSQSAEITGLLCPNLDVLLLPSLPDGRAACPAPRQHSVTSFLLSRKSIFSPDYLTPEGKKRVDMFKEKKVDTVSNPSGELPPLERCITHQGGVIRFGPVSFLAFTPGAAAVDFHFSLWRVWFCFWLGLPLPGDQPGSWDTDRLCRCGGILDPHGYHRLCCNKGDKPGVSSVRFRAHNLITEAVHHSAYLAGLTSSMVASSIPEVPGSSDKKGDIYIRHPIPSGRARGPSSFNGTIGDVALVSFKNTNGVWEDKAMDNRAKKKEKHYRKYDEINWNFEALITNVGCNLSANLLRLLYYLAELQTEKAMQSECVGDNPEDILHLFALRSRARVACAVAVGTAMRLLGSARDVPRCRPIRGTSFVPVDHDADVPLFPLGSEDSPVFTPFPLARGSVEYVEGAAADGSLI
jgi:ribonuclease HI